MKKFTEVTTITTTLINTGLHRLCLASMMDGYDLNYYSLFSKGYRIAEVRGSKILKNIPSRVTKLHLW